MLSIPASENVSESLEGSSVPSLAVSTRLPLRTADIINIAPSWVARDVIGDRSELTVQDLAVNRKWFSSSMRRLEDLISGLRSWGVEKDDDWSALQPTGAEDRRNYESAVDATILFATSRLSAWEAIRLGGQPVLAEAAAEAVAGEILGKMDPGCLTQSLYDGIGLATHPSIAAVTQALAQMPREQAAELLSKSTSSWVRTLAALVEAYRVFESSDGPSGDQLVFLGTEMGLTGGPCYVERERARYQVLAAIHGFDGFKQNQHTNFNPYFHQKVHRHLLSKIEHGTDGSDAHKALLWYPRFATAETFSAVLRSPLVRHAHPMFHSLSDWMVEGRVEDPRAHYCLPVIVSERVVSGCLNRYGPDLVATFGSDPVDAFAATVSLLRSSPGDVNLVQGVLPVAIRNWGTDHPDIEDLYKAARGALTGTELRWGGQGREDQIQLHTTYLNSVFDRENEIERMLNRVDDYCKLECPCVEAAAFAGNFSSPERIGRLVMLYRERFHSMLVHGLTGEWRERADRLDTVTTLVKSLGASGRHEAVDVLMESIVALWPANQLSLRLVEEVVPAFRNCMNKGGGDFIRLIGRIKESRLRPAEIDLIVSELRKHLFVPANVEKHLQAEE